MKKTRTLRINQKGTWGWGGGDGSKGTFSGYAPGVHRHCLHHLFVWPLKLARVHPGIQTSFSRELDASTLKLHPGCNFFNLHFNVFICPIILFRIEFEAGTPAQTVSLSFLKEGDPFLLGGEPFLSAGSSSRRSTKGIKASTVSASEAQASAVYDLTVHKLFA